MYCRGIRGATTVERNEREEILNATTELLQLMVRQNDLQVEDIASAIFTVTEDLDAEFPAAAARQLGWDEVALMCMREIPVSNSLEKCIRVLLHINTTRSASEICHVYLDGAVILQPSNLCNAYRLQLTGRVVKREKEKRTA
ncbi:MAG TPA: chorismate mutase [Ktedonobacteraceae bacterium]|nr:chorismate mutase [Ktedonobacteraceae bacterium]